MGGGPIDNGGAVKNVVSRNNIWQTHRPTASGWPSIGEWQSAASSGNTYDYDLYNGNLIITATGGRGSHLIYGTPSYVGGTPVAPIAINAGPRTQGYYLQPGSPGYDAGVLLPNFNDNYKGAAPDMGAYENGDVLIITGARSRVADANSLVNTAMVKIDAAPGETANDKTTITQPSLNKPWDVYTEKNATHPELFPNPAASVTTVSFSLSASQHVSIRIFDMMGRSVKTLTEAKMEAGIHQLVWDLRDEKGGQVNTGIYFVKINLGNSSETKKLSVIHK
jgi:hypothetical protein